MMWFKTLVHAPVIAASILLGICASIAHATPLRPQGQKGNRASETEGKQSKSGYDDLSKFGGPGSVEEQLEQDDKLKTPVFRFDGLRSLLDPYYEWKSGLKQESGFAFGTDYTALFLWGPSSPGRDEA